LERKNSGNRKDPGCGGGKRKGKPRGTSSKIKGGKTRNVSSGASQIGRDQGTRKAETFNPKRRSTYPPPHVSREKSAEVEPSHAQISKTGGDSTIKCQLSLGSLARTERTEEQWTGERSHTLVAPTTAPRQKLVLKKPPQPKCVGQLPQAKDVGFYEVWGVDPTGGGQP